MSLLRTYLYDVINDLEAKRELKNYLVELYEQIRSYNKIFNEDFESQNTIRLDKILTKHEEVILKHISYNLKKVNLINEGRWIYSNFDNETKLILNLIYAKNYTWEGVQLELGISKSTISRKRTLAEEAIVNHYINMDLIKNVQELEFYFGNMKYDIKEDISNSNKELKKFIEKMNEKYDNNDDATIYYKDEKQEKVHIMEDEQFKDGSNEKDNK